MLFAVLLWAVAQLVPTHNELASLFPYHALLYLEAKDFDGLLKDWNSSEEKRAWLKGDNYAAFSRSRLFERLDQAQGEFAAAATTEPNAQFLSSVAGTQSALALYDIGNLEFVYITHMNQAQAEMTPLWQFRDKFELRTEGAARFYVRQDQQSNRTAAFAIRDGWLILGTRADLVAGVLDRVQGAKAHNLSDELWYADTLKQASGSGQDLRMALNLEQIVPSPYFRSYWVQRNITEIKQYRAALCDLHRGGRDYREDRVLLRKSGNAGNVSGDVEPLLSLVPSNAAFASAQASPGGDQIVTELRENLLDLKPARTRVAWSAPPSATIENAGNAAMLEERIDVAPVIVQQSDPYQPLRALIAGSQATAMLEAYETRTKADDMFVEIGRAVVIESASSWNEDAVKASLVAALRPGLTASQLGIGWASHSGDAGAYSTLDGAISLSLAVRDKLLFLSSSDSFLQAVLAKQKALSAPHANGITYAAIFNHSAQEQKTFRKIVNRLDAVGHGSNAQPAGEEGGDAEGQAPPFFSHNIASLSRMFAQVSRETVEERDEGAQVRQKVVYEWQHR
jgi:hypothetical protein